MQKKVRVVMLPTKENGVILLPNSSHRMSMHSGTNNAWANSDRYTHQHLYFTTEDEIKEGDWYAIFNLQDEPTGARQCAEITAKYIVAKQSGSSVFKAHCKKVVATTNRTLWVEEKFSHHSQDLAITIYRQVPSGIAKIPAEFIEAYVKEQGNIKEVMLECQSEYYDGNGNAFGENYLELNPDGAVIWHPIEPKMYTGEEVVVFLEAYTSLITSGTITENGQAVGVTQSPGEWFDGHFR